MFSQYVDGVANDRLTQQRARRPRYRLNRVMCSYCRAAKQKCLPADRQWPGEKCTRCLEKGLPCSESRLAKAVAIRSTEAPVSSNRTAECPPLAPKQHIPISGGLASPAFKQKYTDRQDDKTPGVYQHYSFSKGLEPLTTDKTHDLLILLGLHSLLLMALEELKALGIGMIKPFCYDPIQIRPTERLPDLGQVFNDYKRFSRILDAHILNSGAGELLSYALAALRPDYNRRDLNWGTEKDGSQRTNEDIEMFCQLGHHGFAHVLQIKKLLERPHLTRSESTRLAYCRNHFLLNFGKALKSGELLPHTPQPLHRSQAFIPSKLLRIPTIAEHVESVGLQDCLGRSVSHILADAGLNPKWPAEHARHSDTLQRTALYLECQNDNINLVAHLIASGADVEQRAMNGLAPLHVAAISGRASICLMLWRKLNQASSEYKDRAGRSALMWASLYGHRSIVEYFARRELGGLMRQDKFGSTALSLAVYRGNIYIVRDLMSYLQKVLVPRQSQQVVNIPDNRGRSPFWYAAKISNYPIMICLVRGGAEVSEQDKYGFRPLAEAARQGNAKVVRFLLNLNQFEASTGTTTVIKVDAKARDHEGKTPLVLAVEAGNVECAKLLVQYNPADFNVKHEQDMELAQKIAWKRWDAHMLKALGLCDRF